MLTPTTVHCAVCFRLKLPKCVPKHFEGPQCQLKVSYPDTHLATHAGMQGHLTSVIIDSDTSVLRISLFRRATHRVHRACLES